MRKHKVNQLIELTIPYGSLKVGAVGKILDYTDKTKVGIQDDSFYPVEMDKETKGHSVDGLGRDGACWVMSESAFKPIDELNIGDSVVIVDKTAGFTEDKEKHIGKIGEIVNTRKNYGVGTGEEYVVNHNYFARTDLKRFDPEKYEPMVGDKVTVKGIGWNKAKANPGVVYTIGRVMDDPAPGDQGLHKYRVDFGPNRLTSAGHNNYDWFKKSNMTIIRTTSVDGFVKGKEMVSVNMKKEKAKDKTFQGLLGQLDALEKDYAKN